MRSKAWIVSGVAALVFVLLGFVGWKALWRPSGPDPLAPFEEAWTLKEMEKTILALEDQIAKLGRELEEKSREIAALRARLGEPEPLYRQEEPPRTADRGVAREEIPPGAKFYTTVRATSVYEVPSASGKKLATLPKGITLIVVGFADGWLEVRSRHGRAPGFVPSADAAPASSGN